jgi:hypothetical protein
MMTNSTFEQALAVVRSLPLEDKQRLRQWLAEEELKLAGQNGADATSPALHREREMQSPCDWSGAAGVQNAKPKLIVDQAPASLPEITVKTSDWTSKMGVRNDLRP